MNPSVMDQLQQATGQAPAQPQQASGPSWWQKLLPTAGGILGGLVGTLADPITFGMGSVIGAGLGGAAGKAAENATTGQAVIQGNDLTSGLSSAAGQGIGNVVGGGLSALSRIAENPLDNLATGMVQKQLAGGEAAMSMHPNQVARGLMEQGVSDVRQIPQIAGAVTGENGALNYGLEQGIQNAVTNGRAGVDVSGLVPAAKDAVANEALITENSGNKIINAVTKANDIMYGGKVDGAGGGVSPSGLAALGTGADMHLGPAMADPQTVLDQVRNFESQGAKYSSSGNVESQAVGRVYRDMADNLKDALFAPGGQPIALDASLKSDIIDRLAPLKDSAPGVYKTLTEGVNNAESVADLRPLQKLWVNASQGYQAATNNKLMAAAMGPGDIAKGTLGVAGSPKAKLLSLGLNSDSASRLGAGTMSRIADVLGSSGMQKALSQGAGASGVFLANAPNYVSPPTTTPTQGGTEMNPAMLAGAGGMMGGASPLNTVGLTSQLDAMLKVDPYLASSLVPALTSLTPQAQSAGIANQLMGQYQQTLAQAGGPQGPFGGLLSRLGGMVTGGPAAMAGPQQAQAAAALSQATGIPFQQALQAIPGLMQNQAGAMSGFGGTGSILNAIQ